VIFGENASQMEEWGNTAYKHLGLSKEAAIAAASGFGDMFSQIGFTGDEALHMSRSVVQAAADLGSFSNLDTADVADRMAAAFRGEYDSLQQVIPNINAARVEQEAMAATGKDNAKELTAQEKAAAVLAIVHKDGARAMGDFERTSSGAANSQKILTAKIEDQQTKLGTQLMPMWKDFLGFLSNTGLPVLGKVIEFVGKNTSWLFPLAGAIGVVAAAQVAWNIAQMLNPTALIVAAIIVLIGAIAWVATQTTFFQDVWKAMTDAIGIAWQWLWGTVLSPTIDAIVNGWQWLVDVIGGGINGIVDFFGMLKDGWDATVDGISTAITAVGNFFGWLGDTVAGIFAAIGEVFKWIYETIIMPVVTGIMVVIGLWAALISWLYETAVAPLLGAIGGMFAWLGQTISDIIGGIVTGVINAAAALITWWWETVINPVLGFIGAAFDWLVNTVVVPLVAAWNAAMRVVGDVFLWLWNVVVMPVVGFIVGAFQAVVGGAVWLGETVAAIVSGAFTAAITGAGNVVRWLWETAISPTLHAIGDGFNWVVGNIITPVGNTITGIINNIGKTVRDVFNGIPGFFRSAFESALGVIRGPVNGIIGLINGAIRGINGLHVAIPDWVPIVGGQTFGLHIPTIPMLARGSNNAPDTFIAGENGPELITGARGATVRPYSATEDILNRGGLGGGKVTVELTQNISHPDPTIAGRQAARALTARLGI
jgi:phage-related protein